MKTAESNDDVHSNAEDVNIEAHAEMGWHEPLVASNCSFVDRDRDAAAAVALAEIQDGHGNKLVNTAGEITEHGQRAQSQNDIPNAAESHTYSDQLVHLAKLGLPQNCLPTQEALLESFMSAGTEKYKELRRSYDFLKNAIAKYDAAMRSVSSPGPSPHTDLSASGAINGKNSERVSARSEKKASRKRKRRGSTSCAVAKRDRVARKRTRRLVRLGLADHGPDPTQEVLAEAYAQQMQKLQRSAFPSNNKKQRAKRRLSRAFRYLMKLCAEEKTPCV